MEERFGAVETPVNLAMLQLRMTVKVSITMCWTMIRKYTEEQINNDYCRLLSAGRSRHICFGSL